jgi:membrane-bound lytic murein transglycosylase D
MIAATAKSMGLRIDEWVDERRDPVKATRAAARYLSTLHGQFGSWPLALAAYNAGPAPVLEAIRRLNTNDYWTLSAAGALPTETVRYVPRVYSAMIAGHAPGPNGFGDVVFEPPVRWREVLVPAGVDLRDLAKKSGVPLATLRALNPELKRGFTPPDGVEYPLRVPPERVARVEAVVDTRVSRLPKTFVEHRVRFGERLRDVAADYGSSRAELRRLNELAEGDPAPGTLLLVPDRGYRPPRDSNQLLVSLRRGVRFDPGDRDEVYFAVRYRMPLAEVARFFGVAPADVGMWNGLDPEADLQRGMAIRLFVPREFDTSTALVVRREAVKELRPDTEGTERALSEAAEERAPTVTRVLYRVKRGDTLSRIAKRYNVTVAQLRAENGLSDGDALSPGDELHVPVRQKARARGKTTSGGRPPRASLPLAGRRAA